MQRPLRIVYWLNQASPYMVSRFGLIAAKSGLDFEGWFTQSRTNDRSWRVESNEWQFPAELLLNSTQSDGRSESVIRLAAARRVFELLRQRRPDVFVCEYDRPDFAAGILMAKHYAARVGVRVLPTFDAWSPTNPAKTLAKHAIFRLVDGAKVSGPEAAELAARYGLPRERTFRVRQTVDVSHYSSAVAMKDSERQHRRMSMGLFGCTFIYAGRLWRGKGLDTLFAAYEALLRDGLNVSLLLIGNGADEAYYRQRAANMARVIFAGFHQVEEMPSLYRLGDVLVFPTLGDPHGLVVEEGMASGLPVISSMSAGHITERIIPGSNGFLFATGDTGELGDRMRRLALDANLRASLSDGARATVRLMGHEMYADDFEAFVTQIMALPRRRPW